MSEGPVIRFEGVEKRYDHFTALAGIDAEIERGSVVVLCGPSGSGKTTLVRTINGLEPIQAGHVLVEGRDIHGPGVNINKLRMQIGFVFQQFNLFPHMTVMKNLVLAPVKLRKMPKGEATDLANRLLARVGLADKGNAYPAHLSGGQQQRVAIARALAMEPTIMLLDEPTSALDPEMSAEVLEVMKELASSGMTLVCVTHEMGFARQAADEIWFMQDGKLLERSSPAGFFDSATERVQRFLAQITR